MTRCCTSGTLLQWVLLLQSWQWLVVSTTASGKCYSLGTNTASVYIQRIWEGSECPGDIRWRWFPVFWGAGPQVREPCRSRGPDECCTSRYQEVSCMNDVLSIHWMLYRSIQSILDEAIAPQEWGVGSGCHQQHCICIIINTISICNSFKWISLVPTILNDYNIKNIETSIGIKPRR